MVSVGRILTSGWCLSSPSPGFQLLVLQGSQSLSAQAGWLWGHTLFALKVFLFNKNALCDQHLISVLSTPGLRMGSTECEAHSIILRSGVTLGSGAM